MEIQSWLDAFRQAWIAGDVEGVLSLFTPDIEYWETPYVRLDSLEAVAEEWQGVRKQSAIELDMKVFASAEHSHSVIWGLSYINASGEAKHWAGTYLIRLNEAGKCTYFHQAGEPKPQ